MQKQNVKNLALGAVMTALMCVLAPISIPLDPVPITLSVFCAFLIGLVLPGHYGLLAILVYVALAIIGLPVCANYTGGAAVVFGPTGGYIIGYFFIVLLTAMGKHTRNTWALFAAMLGGLALCYVFGTAWFMISTGNPLWISLSWCVLPFIPFDVAKGAASLALVRLLQMRGVAI